MASEHKRWMKSVPNRIAQILGYDVLPAAMALEGDGVPRQVLNQKLPGLRWHIDYAVDECERVRLSIKPDIRIEYEAMRYGQSELLGLTQRALSIVDTAMEWAEESLLSDRGYALPAGSGHTRDDGGVSDLSDLDFTHGLSPDQLDVLRSYLDSREFAAGTVIFEEGSIGAELFILSTGQVSARTTLEHGRRMRLTTFSPGVVFGEMALLDGSTRSATAIADSDAQCMALTADSYRRLSDEHAEIALVLTRNLGHLMAERLRLTNGQLRALEA